MQRHLGANVLQPLHQEMGGAHPGLDGAERVLDRLAPLSHGLRVLIEPLLDSLEHMLVLPAADPALFARGALRLQGAGRADGCPIAAQGQAVFFACEAIGETRPGRTDIDVLIGDVAKVLFAEPALRLGARGQRLRQRDDDLGPVTGQDLRPVEVATVGDDIELVDVASGHCRR